MLKLFDWLKEGKDIRLHPRVITAYEALVNKSPGWCSHQQETFCDVCGIPGSIETVAFDMYLKLDQFDRLTFIRLVYGRDNDTFILRSLDAEMMIIASVLAWEAK